MKTTLLKLVPLLLFIFIGFNSSFSQWLQSAGPQGSNVNSFYSPDQKTVFAGTFGDGVFRSGNLGATWQAVNTGLAEGNPRYDYAFTSAGNYLFVGTQDGVYRSSNNGDAWEPANTGMGGVIVFSLAKFIVTNTTTVFAGTQGGVYKSMDYGSTWSYAGLTDRINALVFKTQNGTSLFAVSGYGSGVFRSDDFGTSWINVNNGIPASVFMNDVIVTGQNIFVATYGFGVYKSTNNGLNWNAVNTGFSTTDLPNMGINSLSFFNNALYAATSSGIYKSTNLGTKWVALTSGLYDTYFNRIYSFAYNFFAGSLVSVFASFNEGSSWEPVIDGLPYENVSCMAAKTNILFTGSNYYGVSYSNDNADTWYPINLSGMYGIYTYALGIKGNTVLEGTRYNIYRSTNNGKKWAATNFSGGKVISFASNSTFAFCGSSSTHGKPSGSVFRSSDDGINWTEMTAGVFSSPAVALAAYNSNIFAGNSLGVFRSTNNGVNWTLVNSGLTTTNISSLVIKGSTLFAGTDAGVFRTTNNGNNWVRINMGLTDTAILALTYTTNQDRIFAGTQSGMFYTTVTGTKWTKINSGLKSTYVTCLATDNDFIYAAIASAGVWKYSLAKINDKEISTDNSNTKIQTQNYPNPFNPATVISFQVKMNSKVTLRIYDAMGREIQTLMNENMQPGMYDVKFDGSQLPSGVYYYKMVMDGFTETKKMILIK
jgi:photosystem II stability/assembly factor-like uncharacterized protein